MEASRTLVVFSRDVEVSTRPDPPQEVCIHYTLVFFFLNNMLKPEAAQPVWMIQGCFQTNVCVEACRLSLKMIFRIDTFSVTLEMFRI